jgi:hypothetical protein
MQTKQSINYNSNASNGQLGLGFSLSGLSVIHRCAKTIVTDGIKGGVNYNNNDSTLCFNLRSLRIAIFKSLSRFGFYSPIVTVVFNFAKTLSLLPCHQA